MDLSTIRKKFGSHEYPTAQAFFADFKLMIRNCFQFNLAGIELQQLFDDKWKNLPQPKLHLAYDDDMDAEGDDSEDDNQHSTPFSFRRFPFLTESLCLGITEMEKRIKAMRGTVSALKFRQQPTPTTPSSSKPTKAAASSSKKATTTKSGEKSTIIPGDDDVLTFEQKKGLSEAIQVLDDQKLERVIQIIHEGVPEI